MEVSAAIGPLQSGFTLIELVVVIVIIGILAAAALPRFVDLTGEARKSSAQGLAGSLSGAAAMVHGKWAANGLNAAESVTIGNNTTVATSSNGYPSGASKSNLVKILQQDPANSGNWIWASDASLGQNSSGIAWETTGGDVKWQVKYDPNTGTALVQSTTN